MELKDLVGKHMLSGVDQETNQVKIYESLDVTEPAQCLRFVLDGVTYTAIEDPHDGWRSSMEELIIGGTVTNTFPAQEVMCVMRPDGDSRYSHGQVLDMIDTTTWKTVISIGTQDYDDYYPYFVGEFTPENMAINAGK